MDPHEPCVRRRGGLRCGAAQPSGPAAPAQRIRQRRPYSPERRGLRGDGERRAAGGIDREVRILRGGLRIGFTSAKIRPLRLPMSSSEARREKRRGRESLQFLNGDVKKDVDETPESLHNLVSLLLTQQRSRRRVVRSCSGALCDAIFKNLQPISVGA
ncbi:hypothetical protein PSAC2689_250001 [Paraburkholderia sacchari]